MRKCMYGTSWNSWLFSRMKRLLTAMYGHKQAHKAWHTRTSGDLIRMGFSELKCVSCVFIEWFGTGLFV
jgi:hypothetical protein